MNLLCQTLYHFDWDLKDLQESLEKNQSKKTIFDFNLSDSNHAKNRILATVNSCDQEEEVCRECLLEIGKNFSENHPKLKAIFSSYRNQRILKKILPKLLTASTNTDIYVFESEIDMTIKENSDRLTKQSGNDSFFNIVSASPVDDPHQKLLKRSCLQSVVSVTFNGKNVWIVTCNISAGEFLTELHQSLEEILLPREKRHDILGFKCDCRACAENWDEIPEEVKIKLDAFFSAEETKKVFNKFRETDSSDLFHQFKNLLPVINLVDSLHPCLSAVACSSYLKWIIHLLSLPNIFKPERQE